METSSQKIKCVNCSAYLIPCLQGQSWFCMQCNEEYYLKKGKLVKGSEALRIAQDDCKK